MTDRPVWPEFDPNWRIPAYALVGAGLAVLQAFLFVRAHQYRARQDPALAWMWLLAIVTVGIGAAVLVALTSPAGRRLVNRPVALLGAMAGVAFGAVLIPTISLTSAGWGDPLLGYKNAVWVITGLLGGSALLIGSIVGVRYSKLGANIAGLVLAGWSTLHIVVTLGFLWRFG